MSYTSTLAPTSTRSRSSRARVLLCIAVINSQLLVAYGTDSAADAITGGAFDQSNAQMKADCVTSTKRGSTGVKDREYLPSYWTRVGAGSGGYHCWTVDNYSPYGLHWSSDGPNNMKDSVIYRYEVGSAKQLTLELKGGWISLSDPSKQGVADVLTIAVFEAGPPESLFTASFDFKKARPLKGPWMWPKAENKGKGYSRIDPLNVSLAGRGKPLCVVIMGNDSSKDASVRVEIVGLRLVSAAPLPKPALKSERH